MDLNIQKNFVNRQEIRLDRLDRLDGLDRFLVRQITCLDE